MPTIFQSEPAVDPSAAWNAWGVSLHRVAAGGTDWRLSGPVGDHWDWFFLDPQKPPPRQLRTLSTTPLTSPRQARHPDWWTRHATDCPAIRLPDHRTIYLHRAGLVGGDRGTITPLIGGDYQTLGRDQWRLTVAGGPAGFAMRMRFYRTNGCDRLRITRD